MTADEVIQEFGPALARIARSYERNPALCDELLQETFLAIVTALPRLKDPAKLKAFVFRIAHNRAVAHVTQQMRDPRADAVVDVDTHEIARHGPTEEQSMIAHEETHRLVSAVRRLALPYRQVITLVLEDLSYTEIAEVLGISVVNVGVRVNRAKQQLKGMLHDR